MYDVGMMTYLTQVSVAGLSDESFAGESIAPTRAGPSMTVVGSFFLATVTAVGGDGSVSGALQMFARIWEVPIQ